MPDPRSRNLGGPGIGGQRLTSPLSFIFSSSLYGAYHLARRVLPLQWISLQFTHTDRFESLLPVLD